MLPSGKKNNMVEKQLVNGGGQINIGRRRPLGEIRGMGSGQHHGSLTAGASVTVPFSLISTQIHSNFSSRSLGCVRCKAFASLPWKRKIGRKALFQLEFSPASDNGFPKQEESRGSLAVPSIGLLPKKRGYHTFISNNVVTLFAWTQLCHHCQLLSLC